MTKRCQGLQQLKISTEHLLLQACVHLWSDRVPLRWMFNCVCKTQITTLSPCDHSQKKTVLFSAKQAYKYLHSCPLSPSNVRRKQRRGQVERLAKIRPPSILFASSSECVRLSHTCAPVGFRCPLPGVSACCAPGFLFMLLLEKSCWYEVTHSLTLTSTEPRPTHASSFSPSCTIQSWRVISHPYKHSAVDRRFKYVKALADLGLRWAFYLFFTPFSPPNLVSCSPAFPYWPMWHQSEI